MARAAIDAEEIPRLDELPGWPLPDQQTAWFGSAGPEQAFRDAFLGGRMHHGWLIGGPKGIGKATFAYRAARFVLAHPRGTAGEPLDTPLAIAADHKVVRQVAARAHPNLLTLQRPWDDRNKRFKTDLPVDEVRRAIPFFGSTPGEAGWRVVIVDVADDMNDNSANALLKMLEEPPPQAIFLVLAHAPGRLLPTIRSRCRRLDLGPIPESAITAALAENPSTAPFTADERRLAAVLSGGSLRGAILALQHGGAAIARDFQSLVAGLPDYEVAAAHALADRVSARGADDAYEAFLDLAFGWLDRRVNGASEPDGAPVAAAALAAPLERWAEVWEKAQTSAADAEEYNLDRKQVVLSIFMTLARATRM